MLSWLKKKHFGEFKLQSYNYSQMSISPTLLNPNEYVQFKAWHSLCHWWKKQKEIERTLSHHHHSGLSMFNLWTDGMYTLSE